MFVLLTKYVAAPKSLMFKRALDWTGQSYIYKYTAKQNEKFVNLFHVLVPNQNPEVRDQKSFETGPDLFSEQGLSTLLLTHPG